MAQRLTFEEVKLLEEPGDDEGVAEVQQEAAEHQAAVVLVGGVWTRVDVTHGHLRERTQRCL